MSCQRRARATRREENHGVPQATTVQAIYENTADSVGPAEATFIYESAVIHLC